MNRRHTILVTDPEQRAALAAVRSLARAGHRVITFGSSRGLAGWSRGASVHVGADVAGTTAQAEWQLRQAVEAHRVDGILPITDATCRWILPIGETLGATVLGPTAEAYERASDKTLVTAVAERLGIRTPRQVILDSAADLPQTPILWQGDTVIKPARSAVVVQGAVEKFGVQYAEDASILQRAVHALPEAAFPLLLQERCRGEGAGVFLLRAQQETFMQFGHRRIREKPPSGGVSTCREAIEPPPELVRLCEVLLDGLQYEGPAMIEFKRNPHTAEWVLMEINARLWGSTQLAVDAGVDFPLGVLQWAFGEPLVQSRPKADTRTTWELGEIDHAMALLRKSATALHLPSGTPTGPAAAWRALCDRRIDEHPEVFRWRDPVPAMAETTLWLKALLPSLRRNG